MTGAEAVRPAETEMPAETVRPAGTGTPTEAVASAGTAASAEAVASAGRAASAEAVAPSEAGTAGVFGPPPVMPTPPGPSTAVPAAVPSAPPAAVPPAVPAPRDGGPQDDTAAPPSAGRRPGRVSVSVAATSTPEGDGRVRKLSCTVALAVAGAMAAVTIGSVYVFDLLPGRTSDDDTSDSGAAGSDSPPAATASPAPSGAVPAAYLGTWEGQGSALDGRLPLGTFRITVERAAVGQELGRLRQTDQIGGVCVDVLTLKQVTEKELVATSVGAKTNHGGCNPAPTTVHLKPVGDDLQYQSESAESGRPQARLSKVK
ncbi:hypothetical protein QFZ43_003749 [Streptomyces afghaniensis]|nr:hypothetical protein [Streptomyces afghaniensis]